MEDSIEGPSRKRRKLSNGDNGNHQELPRTLTSSISPPPLRRKEMVETQEKKSSTKEPQLINSPIQLTWIQDLPESSNKDAVSLKDILGDPLIAECWEFNYLHDLDFLMDSFDSDVRDLVKVHVIHGFWKNENPSRQKLQMQAAQYPNLTLHTAYMPEMFGTHHSKMLILIRHDSTAQIIIHTANLIPFDWKNMTQALWRSPPLPLLPSPSPPRSPEPPKIGNGSKFKLDLLNYLRAYNTKRSITTSLISTLQLHDFTPIKAALISSIPTKQYQTPPSPTQTTYGWFSLLNALKQVPSLTTNPEIVIQISSIATLGQTDTWLSKTFFKALTATKPQTSTSPEREKENQKGLSSQKPKFKIIFPTPDEIRRSLNGYSSGSAIHTKIQSAAQKKQLQYLKPMLCHWACDGAQHSVEKGEEVLDAGRKRAAPHIKTFIRYSNGEKKSIDWALLTSSNLSKQAWGEATNAAGDIRICSYEIGVLVWPELYGENAVMVPAFKTNTPSIPSVTKRDDEKGDDDGEAGRTGKTPDTVVGFRMPYDLPLTPYGKDDEPWCATASYEKPDWLGMAYNIE